MKIYVCEKCGCTNPLGTNDDWCHACGTPFEDFDYEEDLEL